MERENSNMESKTIDDLNDDCLNEIFSYLTFKERFITEEVCKRWNGISRQGWQDIKRLSLDLSYFKMNRCKTILRRCGRFLKSLRLSLCKFDGPLDFFLEIPGYCPRLEEIHLEFSVFKDTLAYYREELHNFFSKLQQLHTVKLEKLESGSSFDNQVMWLRHRTFEQMSINDLKNTNLRRLSLCRIFVKEESIENWKHLHLLTSLTFNECVISGKDLRAISYFENLESLTLSKIWHIYDSDIAALTNCLRLTELKLNDLPALTSRCVEHIGQIPNLQILVLSWLRVRITEESIVRIPQIHALHLTWSIVFSIEGIIQLILNSSKLRFLSVAKQPAIVKPVIEAVNEVIGNRRSTEKFTLMHASLEPIVVENLSPKLVVKNFRNLHYILDMELRHHNMYSCV